MIEFRFTLSHAIEGSEQIDEPVGWDDTKFILKRDQKYHGVNFEYSTQLKFYRDNGNYNGGAEFILFIESKYGIDENVFIQVEIAHHGGAFETFFTGRLNLEDIQETELFVECNVEQTDFFTTFNQRSDMQVSFNDNLSVDSVALQEYSPYDLNLHSKVLVKQTHAVSSDDQPSYNPLAYTFIINAGLPGADAEFAAKTKYVTIPFPDFTTQEIKEVFTPGLGVLDAEPDEIFNVQEEGLHTFEISVGYLAKWSAENLKSNVLETTNLNCGDGYIRHITVEFFFKIYDKDDNIKVDESFHVNIDPPDQQLETCSSPSATATGVAVFNNGVEYDLEVGDKVKVFFTMYSAGHYFRNLGDSELGFDLYYEINNGSYFKVIGKTFGTGSSGPALKVHDVFQNLVNKITSKDDSFYSEYFGDTTTPYHSYSSKGCGADFAILNGFNLRNFPWIDRPLKPTFDDLYDSIHAIFGIGLGIETINGVEKIRVENLDYFYTKDPVLVLENVRGIQRSVDKTKYFNRVEVGYDKWQPEDINGLDEFATVHNYSLPLKTVGKPKVYKSKIIASGSIIEVTRRMQYDETLTTDSKYDEENFIIALNQSNPAIAEKNENFDQVNNLLSPETAYNLRLSPKRNLLRHGSEINGALLKKLGQGYTFTSGQGNYLMESELKETDTCPGSFAGELLKENQDLNWVYADLPEVDPIWYPELYEFKYPLTMDQFKLIKDNRNKAISISGDLVPEGQFQLLFIQELEYEPTKALAKFRCLKANELPYNYVPEDADNLLLQDGFNLLLEDGGLLLI